MNIHRKFSQSDVAGVFGLMAFLADKDACAERMAELQAMVDSATAELARASEASSDALRMTADAEKLRDEVTAAKASFDEKLAAVDAREQVAAKLAADAKAESVRRGDELAAWENGLEQRETAVRAQEVDHAKREQALSEAEAAVAAMRAEYEDKLAKIKALAA